MEPQKESNPNYLPYPPQSKPADGEIDLRELFKALWKGKWTIIATTFVFAVGSILYALSLPNIYKADALLASAENSSAGGLSQMAGQFGGIAALAGVNLNNSSISQADLAVEVLKSRHFIESFIEKHGLLASVMAVKGWDLKSNKLIFDEDLYNVNSDKWLRKDEGLRGAKPSPQEASQFFKKEFFKISKDTDSGLYKITIEHYSPYVANQWVHWLVEDINKVMRERAIIDTSKNLAYLNTQLEKTAVTDMQNMFYKLIEEQTKSLMLAEAQQEFVFKTVDPAVIPDINFRPMRSIIVIASTLFGLILSCSVLLIKLAFTKKK
ncbi:Wzz/FepE/Etk N-terminal domain-containing protein [Vibrio alginolyticus]